MTQFIAGFVAPWIIYAVLFALHLIVPARTVDGYVTDPATGRPYRYRLNGLPVLLLSVAAWMVLGILNVVPFDWLYAHRWSSLAGAAVLGLISSLLIVAGAPAVRKTFLADYFFGRRADPKLAGGRVDAKMFLYLVGATLLALNLLSFAAHHLATYPATGSAPVVLYVCLFFWFILDYMTFERVHLYTYDLVAERVGFKLTFGCLTFYPYFYAIGLWAVANRPPATMSTPLLTICAVVFLAGWTLARGANMQKYVFKIDPDRPFLGIIPPRTIANETHALLCSGFWGVSRHINYLGEILMATGLTLALGYPAAILPWLYPLYYVLLLLTRQRDDDKRCRAKYGSLWDEYTEQVPRRVLPWIY